MAAQGTARRVQVEGRGSGVCVLGRAVVRGRLAFKVGPVEWRGGAGGMEGDLEVKVEAKARTQMQAQPGT
jgi:hypothetical protein